MRSDWAKACELKSLSCSSCDVFTQMLLYSFFFFFFGCVVQRFFLFLSLKRKGLPRSFVRREALQPSFHKLTPPPTALSSIFWLVKPQTTWSSIFSFFFCFLISFPAGFLPPLVHQVWFKSCLYPPPPPSSSMEVTSGRASQESDLNQPCAKINFLRCQRGLCCWIHWGQGGKMCVCICPYT